MRKKSFNLVLTVLLVFSCAFSDFNVMYVHAESDATKRQKAYIEFASERATVEDTDISTLTKDEMRILGVFLSNFYVPWGTQLVETDDDDASREQMVEILTDTLKFDNVLAEDIVDATFQMSINSATELKLVLLVEKNDTEYWYSVPSFSYFDLLELLGDSDMKVVDEDSGEEYEVLESYLTCNDQIVFDFSYDSPSRVALLQCLRNLPMTKGIGSNIVSVTENIEGSYLGSDNFSVVLDSVVTTDDLYHITTFGWRLYIDCFGNIIVDCGTGRQYVLMPACMNPYVWKKDGFEVGECLPMNNLAWFSESATGNLSFNRKELSILEKDNFKGTYETFVDSSGVSSYYSPSISFNFSSSPNASLENLRIVRGSDKTNLTTLGDKWGSLVGSSGAASESMEELLKVYNSYNHFYGLTVEGGWGSRIDCVTFPASEIFSAGKIFEDYTIQDFIMFDNLGLFSSETESTMVLNAYGIFADENHSTLGGSINDKFKSYLYDAKNNTLVNMSSDEQKKYVAGIYCAYVFAYFERQGTEDGGHVNFRFCADRLPEIGSGSIELTDVAFQKMQEDVLVMAFNLLHPEEGVEYVSKLASNKVEGMLLSWHSDLVGNVNTGSTTGATRYVGVSGYMTTPEISDVGWLNSLFSLYTLNMSYVLLFILVCMLVYAISGYINWQRALVNTVCFGFCIYAIPMLISASISFSNNLTDSFYNDKFTYWAVVQHQSYQEDLEKAIEENDYNDYLVTLFEQQGFEYNSHVVNLRWMCPKKDNYLVNIEKELSESVNSSNMTKLLKGVLHGQLSGEDYSDSANKTYLYRSYTDIASYAEYIYKNVGIRGHNVNSTDPLFYMSGYGNTTLGDYFLDYLSPSGNGVYRTHLGGVLDTSQSLGFNIDTNLDEINNSRFFYFNRSNSISKASRVSLDDLSSEYNAFGVPTSSFNFTIADYNSSMVMPAEKASLGVFAVYSESPYYYLNWNVRDQIYSKALGGDYQVKNLLLSENKGINSYFYNTSSLVEGTDSYGQLRDYMDMRSLFTLVIPYLKECNDLVVEFDNKYDLKMIGDYSVRYTTDSDGIMTLDIPAGLRTLTEDNKDAYYSYWHDVQVSNLFNMYTPWVDSLYSCSYAKPEKVTVAGITYVIEDPLNPASYPESRPMIFSESEMLYYGLTHADLTEVERKILRYNDNCYSALLSLMNYYSFDSEVLISAVAMLETFEFNKEFSETKFLGDSNILYPQGFELKNFSFDAYFRLVLSETTGLDLNSSTSIYETVVEETSLFTAVLILLVDLTAMWGVPYLRLAVVVGLFLMCILSVLSSCIVNKTSGNLSFKDVVSSLSKSVVTPLLKFLGITVVCAWLVSLLLSSGYSGITGKLDYTISLGDPILAMFALLTVNVVLIVFYFNLLLKMFKDGKSKIKGLGASLVAVGAGLGALGMSALQSKSGNTVMSDVSAPSGSGASNAIKPKLKVNNKASEKLAKKQLGDRNMSKLRANADKVKNTVTAPGRKIKQNIDNKRAEQARLEAEQKAKLDAETKRKQELAQKKRDMEEQARMNAMAYADELERREQVKKAQEIQEAEERKRKAEVRKVMAQKGVQQAKERQQNGNQNSGYQKPKSKKKKKGNQHKGKKKR